MSEPAPRTTGDFVVKKKTRPAIEVDCSGWAEAPVGPRLELVVSFDAGTPPTAVFEHAREPVEAAAAAVPDLGLTSDLTRTRTEGQDVVVVLSPSRPATDARERLAEVAEVIRQATQVPVRVAA